MIAATIALPVIAGICVEEVGHQKKDSKLSELAIFAGKVLREATSSAVLAAGAIGSIMMLCSPYISVPAKIFFGASVGAGLILPAACLISHVTTALVNVTFGRNSTIGHIVNAVDQVLSTSHRVAFLVTTMLIVGCMAASSSGLAAVAIAGAGIATGALFAAYTLLWIKRDLQSHFS